MSAPHPVSDFGSELLCTVHEPSLSAAKEDEGFRSDWVHRTVEDEITRGKHLRTEKPSRRKREYDVANIKLSKPRLNETYKIRRTDSPKNYKRGTNPRLCKAKSSPRCTSNAHVMKDFNQPGFKHRNKCTMRLAELAVPTKRQCIDTWRNKSYLLPAPMVERLKQYVMDQRPIVPIRDALYCFQTRKPPRSKKSLKKKHSKSKSLHVPLCKMEARTCALFGQKIAKALRNPLNLSLGSKYDKISQVVAKDISHIMYGRKNANKANLINQPIHTEMSNKVTMWILNILEDASYKLLLEDIRDLEEEEGPVLDFIDDLVANVVTICEPYPVQYESSSESSSTDENNVTEEQYEINLTPVTKSDNDDEELTDAAYFKNEIKYIIYNFDKTSEDERQNAIDENKEIFDEGGTYEIEANQEQKDTEIERNPSEYSNNIDDDNTNADQVELKFQSPEPNNIAIMEHVDANENNNSNVSDEIKEIFDESGTYENEANQEQKNTEIERNPSEYSNNIDDDNTDADQVELKFESPEPNNIAIMEHVDAKENNNSNVSDEIKEIFDESDTYQNEANQEQKNTEIERNPSEYSNNIDDDNTDADQVELKFESPEPNNIAIMEHVDAKENNNSNVSDKIKEIFDESDTYQNEANQEQKNTEIERNPSEYSNNIDDDNTYADQVELKFESPEPNNMDIMEYVDATENNNSNVSDEIKDILDESDTYQNEAYQEQKNTEIERNASEYSNNIDDDNTDADQVELKSEIPEPNTIDIMENVDANENNNSNVSEVFEIFSEESLDDKNKIVKFSKIDKVNLNESKLFTIATRPNIAEDLHNKQEEVSWIPYSDHKSRITFAEPNTNLLSAADELWPIDLPSSTLKASESVSKSITSLGYITETDEKNITPPEAENNMKNIQEQKQPDIIKTIVDLLPSHKYVIEDTNENNICTENTSASKSVIQSFIRKVNETHKKLIDTKQSDEKNDDKSKVIEFKININAKDFNRYFKDKNKMMDTDFTSNFKNIEVIDVYMVATKKRGKDEITEFAAQPIEDRAWKVHPESVPSWVFNARGEPSEGSIPNSRATTAIRDCDIRQWCRHLEDGFKKLELWITWIEKIDKDMNCLKTRKEFRTRCSCGKRKHSKEWTKLTNHVDRDTDLWINMFRSHNANLKTLRRFYRRNRIKVPDDTKAIGAVHTGSPDNEPRSAILVIFLIIH